MKLSKCKDTIYTSIILDNRSTTITDIDSIFKESNKYFANLLRSMFIDLTFDFSKKPNQIMYSHAFIYNMCEYIKNNNNNNSLYFYSNSLTKDPFRLKLLKKVKTIFGFNIYENVLDFTEFVNLLESDDDKITSDVEVFLSKNHKRKSFKHIKKYLERTGLKEMHSNYFEEIANKMMILS
jgi:hypothetical protein